MKQKLLFVCSRNQWRSPTAEALFRRDPHFEARSAGTAASARRRVSAQLIAWADLIFCMEPRHAQQLRKRFPISVPLHVLDIPDLYQAHDPELIEILQSKLNHLIELSR